MHNKVSGKKKKNISASYEKTMLTPELRTVGKCCWKIIKTQARTSPKKTINAVIHENDLQKWHTERAKAVITPEYVQVVTMAALKPTR